MVKRVRCRKPRRRRPCGTRTSSPAGSDENANVGVGSFVGPERAAVDRGVGRGRVDREAARRGSRIDVAGRVRGAHLEGVGAVGERRRGLGRASTNPRRRRRPGTRSVEPASLEENANVGVVSFVGPDGPLSIVVSGAAVSTVKLRDGGRRVDVAGRVGRADLEGVGAVGERRGGLGRRAGGPRAAVDPALEASSRPGSDENAKVGVVSFVGPDGPLSIVVCGAAVSTVNAARRRRRVDVAGRVRRADLEGVGAVGERVRSCGPRCRTPTRRRRRGTRTSSPPGSDENANVGVASLVGPDGPLSIVVCGAAVSTVKLRDAGVASMLPAGVGGAHLEGVGAVGQRGGGLRRRARTPTRRRRRGTRTSSRPRSAEKVKVGVGVVRRAGRARVDRGLRRGGVDAEAARRGRRVDVAGRIGGADLEGVRAVGRATRCVSGVEHERPGAARRRGTRTSSRPGQPRTRTSASVARRADGPLSIVVSRRGRVDREAARRRRRVDVAGRVGRADLEGVGAVRQRAVVSGVEHEAHAPLSTRHSNVEPALVSGEARRSASRRSSGPTGRCRSWSPARPCRP